MISKTLKPYLKYLSDSHIEEIHDGSLDLLENTGIMVDHQGGLEFLEKHGAKVDFQAKRARIPRQLVSRALETVPDRFTLAARNPEKDCPLIPGGRPYSRNGGGADFTIDLETSEFRPLLHADVKEYYKLMDALEGISFIAPVFGQDMPVVGRDILMLREAFNNTDKPIHLRAFTGESLRLMFEMAVIVAGGKKELKERPIVSLLEAPISPLKFLDVTVDALWLCGNPGAPLQYAPRPMAMDMRTGFSLAGSVELGIMATAGAQMAHFYNVPVSLHGPWSDSMTHDGQSIMERMYMNLMAALAGANVLVGAGMMQQSLVISHEQLVIDDEINRIAYRSVEGFEVNTEHLAREAIDRVGPGGNFVADPHTYKFLRGERFEPALQYRNSREAWEEAGSKTLVDRAKEKALAILEEHQPNPLPEDIRKELDKFVAKALKSLEK